MNLLPPHTETMGPKVDPDFGHLNSLQRAAEAWRYCLLNLERWLSPGGQLRAWLRLHLLLSATLLIPALLVMPAIGLILWQLTGWLSLLTTIASRLIVLPLLILLAVISITLVWRITRLLFKR